MIFRLHRAGRALVTTLWFWPLVFIVTGWFLADGVAWLARAAPLSAFTPGTVRFAADYAVPLLTMAAGAVITVVTFVFSTLMVVQQLASGQLSPRVLRKTLREGRAQLVMAVLVGTFVYAVHSLSLTYGEVDSLIPAYLTAGAIVLLLASVASFLFFVGFVSDRSRAPAVIRRVEQETERWLRRVYSYRTPENGRPRRLDTDGLTTTEVRARRAGSITAVSVPALVHWAQRSGAVIELDAGLGDPVTEGVVIGRIHAPRAGDGARRLLAALAVEPERTIPGDPPWGFRILVDIAVRALSPGVNDPTTAVQVIDALENLLAILGTRAVSPGVFVGADEVVRLTMPAMSWRAYLELSVHEIYLYGKTSPQVTQRLARMLDELEGVVSGDRLTAVREVRAQIEVVPPMIPPAAPESSTV